MISRRTTLGLRIVNEIEKSKRTPMEKIEFLSTFEILKEAIQVPWGNPNFIIVTFLTSLPLLFAISLYENILSETMNETTSCIRDLPHIFSLAHGPPIEAITTLVKTMSYKVLQLCLLRFVPLHLLYLLSTITTLESASAIYTREKSTRPSIKERFSGVFFTSTYVLILQFFSVIVLVWFISIYILTSDTFKFLFVYGMVLVVGIGRWVDLCAIWNMSVVISILEERHGVDALVFSAYFNRGSRRRGFVLMLVFFAWWVITRLLWFYVREKEAWVGIAGNLAYLSIVYTGSVMQWVVCMIYFYDCKRRIVEKMTDLENIKFDVGSMLDGPVVQYIRGVSNVVFL